MLMQIIFSSKMIRCICPSVPHARAAHMLGHGSSGRPSVALTAWRDYSALTPDELTILIGTKYLQLQSGHAMARSIAVQRAEGKQETQNFQDFFFQIFKNNISG